MISVVIPLYNKEKQIGYTLRSVLSQTYQDFEIVIVNDGSTDRSIAEVEKFSDTRIRLIHQQNAGVSVARNRGISEAHGDYIALLDADDEWHCDFLATQYALSQKYPQCNVFACNYEFKDSEGSITHTIIRKLPFTTEDGILSNYFEVASCSHPPLWTSAVMIRKFAIQSIGGFPVGIKSGEDLLTWARLACRYQIAYGRKALSTFYIEGYSVRTKPKRIPTEKDYVGDELLLLNKKYHPKEMKRYISIWHKMRASIYMRLRMRNKSIKETMKAIRYNPLNVKLYAYFVLNLIPSALQPF